MTCSLEIYRQNIGVFNSGCLDLGISRKSVRNRNIYWKYRSSESLVLAICCLFVVSLQILVRYFEISDKTVHCEIFAITTTVGV